jgi:RNA polymerase sigma-70 factor (ECF subfamily)
MPVYCLVPPDLADDLHDLLCGHFRDDPSVRVVVDRRGDDRGGAAPAQRNGDTPDQRAPLVAAAAPALPPAAARHASRLRFVERTEMLAPAEEDQDTNALVRRAQDGDPEAFAALYVRYFDRVYAYLRVALRDPHEAEDIAQQAFLQAFNHLGRYEVRPDQPFRPWLFRIARNHLLNHLSKRSPALMEDPARASDRLAFGRSDPEVVESTLAWMSDSEVALFVERLPLAQRQVLTLRHMIGLSIEETAAVLGRTPGSVRQLDFRARRYLEARLTALGLKPMRVQHAPSWAVMRQMRVLRQRRFALTR